MPGSSSQGLSFQERQVCHQYHIYCLKSHSRKCGSTGLNAQDPMELIQCSTIPEMDDLHSLPGLIPIHSISFIPESPFIAPHPIIPVLLNSICAHTLIDSNAQSSLISKSFSFFNHFPETPLKKPIPIHSIDGKPLSNGFISHTVLTNCCIQEHTKYKTCGIVEMNCDLVLSIDWLQQHNPSIDWESNGISFSCCSTNSVIPKSGDTLTLNEFPLENPNVGHSSIQISLVSVEEFFNQDQISLFGMINCSPILLRLLSP